MRAVLGFVDAIHDARDVRTLASRTTAMLPSLVPSAITCYLVADRGTRRVEVISHGGDPVPAADRARYQQHIRQHPVVTHHVRTADRRAYAISDFVKREEWHRRELFQECFRPLAIEDQLGVALRPARELFVALSLNRDWRTFRSRDRALLTAIQPHLERVHANAQAFDRVRSDLDLVLRGLDAANTSLILLDRHGGIEGLTSRARATLERHFGWTAQKARLPRELRDHARAARSRRGAGGVPPVLHPPAVVQREDVQIVVSTLTVEDGKRTVLLLEERPRVTWTSAMARLGVSAREADVLQGLVTGLTNKELANLLSVSESTVKTHLDHIYAKLNVTTRTAAVALALRAAPNADGLAGGGGGN